MYIEPYLFFNGCCEEALEFYRKAVSGEIQMIMRYRESPEPAPPGMVPPGFEDKIMHGTVRIGDSTVMVSDGCDTDAPTFRGFSLTLNVGTAGEADHAFEALADGGQVQMPMGKTFWSPRFGMVTDRFGISWMINVESPQER